jgi:PKD repeat protein
VIQILRVFFIGSILLLLTACECTKDEEKETFAVSINGDETQSVKPGVVLSLSASVTQGDSNSSAYDWDWSIGNETVSNTTSYDFNKSEEGNYTVKVTVTDNSTNTAVTDSVIVIVTDGINAEPVAKITADFKSVDVNQTVTLDGSDSSDSDGNIESYAWKKDNTTLGTNSTLSYIPTTSGTHTISLTVTDDGNASGSADINISATVSDNVAPIANAGADRTVDINDTVALSGSSSTDSDGSISSYKWSQDGVEISTTENFDYNRTETEGNYTIVLEVTDDQGAKDEDTLIITVQEP